jgi:hypothetical protein
LPHHPTFLQGVVAFLNELVMRSAIREEISQPGAHPMHATMQSCLRRAFSQFWKCTVRLLLLPPLLPPPLLLLLLLCCIFTCCINTGRWLE